MRLFAESRKLYEAILLTFSWLTAATTLTAHRIPLILPATPYPLAAKVASGIRKRINVAVQLICHEMRHFVVTLRESVAL
jgi:hypothetical protein